MSKRGGLREGEGTFKKKLGRTAKREWNPYIIEGWQGMAIQGNSREWSGNRQKEIDSYQKQLINFP